MYTIYYAAIYAKRTSRNVQIYENQFFAQRLNKLLLGNQKYSNYPRAYSI